MNIDRKKWRRSKKNCERLISLKLYVDSNNSYLLSGIELLEATGKAYQDAMSELAQTLADNCGSFIIIIIITLWLLSLLSLQVMDG